MRGINELLAEYGESHRHPVNKRIHWVCVPLIMWSLLGLLWILPVPAFLEPANWAVIITAAAMLYYLRVSPPLAAGIFIVFAAMLGVVVLVGQSGASILLVCVSVFVLSWIGQFVGHAIEGRRPSFFKDIQFLLIGPLWLLAFVYRATGIRY